MSQKQKTDVVLDVKNRPFITLTESKLPNVWFHDKMDRLFYLTENGFLSIKGSKKELIERGYIDC
jgi:hypothetical protein